MNPRLGIIGGYLGSGKTTLINLLLAGALPGRTAVVVNDFGAVNIDAELIVAADGDTIELSNGCICCQLSDDVARTMSALATREDLDNVICEVSGVGDPGELAAWRSYPGFAPGPVIVCADATAIARLSRDQYVADTVRRQLKSAEIILITKTDLATPADIRAAHAVCKVVAPDTLVIEQDPLNPQLTAAAIFTTQVFPLPPADQVSTDEHVNAHATCTLEIPGPLDVDSLEQALIAQTENLVRAKGIVQDTSGSWHELQLAGGRVELTVRAVEVPAPDAARLVLIAAGANKAEDLEMARTALAEALSAERQLAPER